MTDNSNFNASEAIQPSTAVITNFSFARAILPSFTSLPLKTVLAMDLRGYQITQKMDGRTASKTINGVEVVGEQMPDGSFYAFDLRIKGTLRARWEALRSFESPDCQIVPSGYGAEFVEAIFANPKAEGVVLKNWDSGFAVDWAKCKRTETFDVAVTGKLAGAIALSYEGQDAGKCSISGANYDLVQVGDVVEIAAYKRNASGKFREPRFIRLHPSKNL